MSHSVLEIENMDVSLAGASILRGVELAVGQGECVGLVGHNGAGKTTTLRAIMGLASPSQGVVRLDGVDRTHYPAFKRASLGVGYSPEDRRMVGALSVHDNLLLPGIACHFAKQELSARIERIYDLLPQLGGLRHRMASTLSGGQQKIVALGRAMMSGKKLLLLDEPFQGLAPALARDYGRTLANLKEHEKTLSILISESNPALLDHFVNRLYHIERGEVSGQPVERQE